MAQTMQAFLANMLEMRKQNADAARFRAAMQQREQEEWSDFVSQMGAGISNAITKNAPTARDRLANQMMQAEYTIPGAKRAQAVNPAMQGTADAIASNMYKGGVAEFEMRQKMEDQIAQREMEALRTDAATTRNLASGAQLGIARERLAQGGEALELRRQAMEQQEQARIAKEALDATKLANKQYMETFNNATAYNKRMTSHLKQISTAKDPIQWQAGVDAMNAEYQAGIKIGLKVAEPTVRPFLDEEQKSAIAMEEQRLKAMPRHSGVLEDQTPDWMQWPRPQQERSALAAEEKIKGMPGYAETRPGYAPPPQPEGIFATVPPPPDLNTPSPSASSQAVGGTASGTAAPQPISAEEAFKMTGVRRAPGKRFDSGPGTQVYVVK